MYSKPVNLILLIVLSLFVLNGCLPILVASTAAGSGVAYVMGDLEEIMDADPAKVAEASEKALKKLEIHIISNESTKFDSKIIGRTANDKKITITAKANGENRSDVTIRIGFKGDQSLSRKISDTIKEEL